MLEDNHGAGRYFGSQHDQGSVRADRQGLGLLLEASAMPIGAANDHTYLHKDALAAAPSVDTHCRSGDLSHVTSPIPL